MGIGDIFKASGHISKAWTPTCVHPYACILPAKAFQYYFLEAMFINEGSGVYDVKKAVV